MVTPVGVPGRADRDVPRIATGAALELRVADRHQAPGRRHAIEVGDAFRLGETVVHEPGLAFERRGRVGVDRLVAVEEDAPPLVQELQRVERHAGEGPAGGQLGIGPGLRPVGADEDDRALGNDPVLPLEWVASKPCFG
jgi:hypothetical protein